MSSDFSVVDPTEIEREPFPESGNRHRKLTAPLDCTEMRINMVTLEPGEATAPHSHERQEEVYVALDGGHAQVDDREVEVPAGGIVRVAPQSVRSVHNNTETERQRWLMFGAPPVGSISDFGEYVVPEEDGSGDT